MRTMKNPRLVPFALALSTLALAGACGDDDTESPAPKTISSLVAESADFDTLQAALEAADLTSTLAGAGPFTVFAPTDDAFTKLPAGALDALLADKAALTEVLLYHVVDGAVRAETVVTLDKATTKAGLDVSIKVVDGKVYLNDTVMVTQTDVTVDNGIIHVIDAVLLPPEPEPEPRTIVDLVVGNDDFDTLEAAVIAADLADTLAEPGPFTVFAPTDAAFAALPAGTLDALLADEAALTEVLLYHVIDGAVTAASATMLESAMTKAGLEVTIDVVDGKLYLNGSVMVTQADIIADNGVIHVIDAVLLPPETEPAPNTIADIVVGSDDFDTLEAAVIAADLAGVLSGPGPFTVFAPTDDAFAKLPAGTIDELLADKAALTDVLTYHAVAGEKLASDVLAAPYLTMVNGAPALVSMEGGKAMINGAVITVTDIRADNGVIHVIDTVILPPPTIAEIVASDDRFETLLAAVTEADLVGTLGTAGPFTVFAPTDDAFAAVPADALAALLADKAALTDVLLFHLVDGIVPASVAVTLTSATMKNGDTAPVTYASSTSTLSVGGANVIIANVLARNGIIHAIDKVLLPAD